MWDYAHHDTRLVDKLRMLWGTSAVPCSICREGTNSVRLGYLGKVSGCTFRFSLVTHTGADRLFKILDCLILACIAVTLLVM